MKKKGETREENTQPEEEKSRKSSRIRRID
jgi:hypothetical protein